MAFWRPYKIKKTLAIVVVPLVATFTLSSCATAIITDSGTDCGITDPGGKGNAPVNLNLFMAIKYNTPRNNRLALSMFETTYIESAWNNKARGGHAYGVYQIEGPGVIHPDITIPQAENPAYATNYMLPFYKTAFSSVPASLWSSDPAMAAMRVGFNAERPAGWPVSNLQYDRTFRIAYKHAVAAMNKVGIPTNFASKTSLGQTTQNVSVADTTDVCSGNGDGYGGPVDTGSAEELARKILANPKIDLNGFVGVKQDIINASEGKPGTAGVMTSSAILRLIATIGETHSVLITAIQSEGRLHCHGIPKSGCPNDVHYVGDAVDFGSLDGQVSTGGDSGSLTIIAIAEKVLAKTGGGFGQSQTRKPTPLPQGFSQFWDTPNHLHVEVPRGTP